MRKKIERISIADSNIVSNIASNIVYLFWEYIGDYYMEDIDVIVIHLTVSDYDKDFYIFPSDKSQTYNLKHLYVRIDENFLLSLNDYDKIKLVCEIIYKSLLDLVTFYSEPIEPIVEAYKKIQKNDFYLKKEKIYKSKNKKYTCWLEHRNEFTTCTYRLGFMNEEKLIKYFIIRSKEYPNYEELEKIDYMKWLKAPRFLKVTGWISNNEFEMYWGDEEKYIFDAKKEEVKEYYK